MIYPWLAPMHAMAATQRHMLALLLPPPMAAVTFPGDLARAVSPWAAFWPVMQVAAGTVPGPWLGVGVRMPIGGCGVVTFGRRQ